MMDAEKTTDAVAILHGHYVEGKPESVMVAFFDKTEFFAELFYGRRRQHPALCTVDSREKALGVFGRSEEMSRLEEAS